MTPPLLVSVVITTFNRSDALLAVLRGLLHQTDKYFEVVIADDGSRFEHVEAVKNSTFAKALKPIYVWHPDVGFTASRARNRGVGACSGDYIIFLDGDCVPEVDFVAHHRILATPGYFVNGSRILLSERLSRRVTESGESLTHRSIWYWLTQRMLGNINKLTGLLRLPDGRLRVDHGVPWTRIRSCNMAVWRSDFEHIDGFDESFVGWGHEDADFVLRLVHAGVRRKNGFCATEVFHLWHREAIRAHASLNAATVAQRALSDVTLPTLGYSQQRANDDALTTRLG
jgi:glycosyltransferase involved in cell wall biosynthesis